MGTIMLGTNDYGEKLYRVGVANGTAWLQVFMVYAYNEQEAVDYVADYCEKNGLEGLYWQYYELEGMCEDNQTPEEYAEAHNLTCCGNHGIYLDVAGLEEVK